MTLLTPTAKQASWPAACSNAEPSVNRASDLGEEMHRLIAELYPICRSITGDGVRETLRRLQHYVPLSLHEVPSGTRVFDWEVPAEWNIRDAYVKNRKGERVIDFQDSNLHVLNYSAPVSQRMSLAELKPHLFTLPEQGDLIPYRTSYYEENWGFCLSHKQFLELNDEEEYEVLVDATLRPGSLTYGECYLPGQESEEFLLTTHVCHPSLCNDNLSGIALLTFLAQELSRRTLKYSYRLLFIPGTIGAIAWLAANERQAANIRGGVVVSEVGDAGAINYKQSRRGNAQIDRAFEHVLRHSDIPFEIREFDPYGHDERQFCSPGFNLAVGAFTRSRHGTYPEYHTSADNLSFVRQESLAESLAILLQVVDVLEQDAAYLNTSPKCEPQLGRRGLYRTIGGFQQEADFQMALLWVLNLSDKEHSLLEIAERARLPFRVIQRAAEILLQHNLLTAS